jgi:hypothetical protein
VNAWLLTWEGTEGPALAPDKKVVAILSSRRIDCHAELTRIFVGK